MVQGEAVFEIDVHEEVIQCLAVVLGPGCDFADEADGGRAVLVAYFVERQETEAFFAAANVLLDAFVFADEGCNPFEAGVAVHHLHAVLLGNLLNQLGGHDGLHQELVAFQLAEFFLIGDDVPGKHHAGLVSIEDFPFALWVAADDSEAVCVGVRSNDEVGVQLCAEFHT